MSTSGHAERTGPDDGRRAFEGRMEPPHYIASGRSHRSIWPLGAAAFAGAVLLAWGYQALLLFLEMFLLNLLATLAFALVLGGLAWHLVDRAHLRSSSRAVLLSVLLAVMSLAASYVWAWRMELSTRFAETPVERRAALEKDFTLARWVEHRRLRSVFAPFYWGAEALFVVWTVGTFAAFAGERPYCEACGRWSVEKRLAAVQGRGREEAQGRLRRRDLVGLVTLDSALEPEPQYQLMLIVHACPGCERTWLSVREKRREQVAHNQERTRNEFVCRFVELDAEAARLLRERANAPEREAA